MADKIIIKKIVTCGRRVKFCWWRYILANTPNSLYPFRNKTNLSSYYAIEIFLLKTNKPVLRNKNDITAFPDNGDT